MLSTSAAAADNSRFSSYAVNMMNMRGVSSDEQSAFATILDKAHDSAAGSPKTFLNSLSSNEMEILRKVHSLADPISIAGLDTEGAANLLEAPGEAQDLNNDGLLSIGAGKIWQYPPPNAPAAVKQAWEEATAGIPESEKWMMMAPFMISTISANMKADGSGLYEPGEDGYRNIYAEAGFSYTKQVQDLLASVGSSTWQRDQDYQQTKDMLTKLLKALENRQVG